MILGNFPAGMGSVIKSIQTIEHTVTQNTTPYDINISTVVPGNSIVLIQKRGSFSATYSSYAYVYSSTKVRLYSWMPLILRITVIEFQDNIINSVQVKTGTDAVSDLSIAITAVNLSKSIIVPCSIVDGNASYTHTVPYVYFNSSTQTVIKGYRGVYAFQIVEFK